MESHERRVLVLPRLSGGISPGSPELPKVATGRKTESEVCSASAGMAASSGTVISDVCISSSRSDSTLSG